MSIMYTATYSPEDNKLRLYATSRLDSELYQRVRKAGFIFAPKQDLFVTPMWTPAREDLLIELAGEIEDEDKSLVERAEERAERFSDYSSNRAHDAESARNYVHSIADHIPLGQPILVGHHSERRARKDAERIENGMRRAVKMWEQSGYWEQRAKGALRAAKYKERPDVRARRIKKLESEKRKYEKGKTELEKLFEFWSKEDITREQALHVCNYFDHGGITLPDGEKYWSAWSALNDGRVTVDEIRKQRLNKIPSLISHSDRWIKHYENRLLYEKTMLGEQGALDLIEKKPRPKQLPLLNYRAPEGITIENRFRKGDFITFSQVEMTTAEYMKIYKERRGTEIVNGIHRVRALYRANGGVLRYQIVFLTDSKIHPRPELAAAEPKTEPKSEPEPLKASTPKPQPALQPKEPEKSDFDAMRQQLKEGIKVVSAPQLFPTPPDIAEQMIDLAGNMAGKKILEPSAGTGNLVKEIVRSATGFDCCDIVAVEMNCQLVNVLQEMRQKYLYANEDNFKIVNADFLECNGNLGKFDRIIMNPPFVNGSDIKHILHARIFLKPGGILVALCANGPRQREKLMPLADEWIDLPEGSFKAEGTGVNVAMIKITA